MFLDELWLRPGATPRSIPKIDEPEKQRSQLDGPQNAPEQIWGKLEIFFVIFQI